MAIIKVLRTSWEWCAPFTPDNSVLEGATFYRKRSNIKITMTLPASVPGNPVLGFRGGGPGARVWRGKLTVCGKLKAEVSSLRGAAMVNV